MSENRIGTIVGSSAFPLRPLPLPSYEWWSRRIDALSVWQVKRDNGVNRSGCSGILLTSISGAKRDRRHTLSSRFEACQKPDDDECRFRQPSGCHPPAYVGHSHRALPNGIMGL